MVWPALARSDAVDKLGTSWLARVVAPILFVAFSVPATLWLKIETNDTNYFSAELGLVQAQLNELLALVQLYKGLGGGWQT